jgi:prenylcysteine oxidase/farnesylcysteine lyase
METETVASRNVIDLLLNEEFQTSVCRARILGSEKNTTVPLTLENEQDFVYGWDC